MCASWSDHGLHSRGSIEGFERRASRQKWLFTRGRKKWETFYGEEALGWQKRFLDHFLRDVNNGMDRVPQVRLEARRAYYQQDVRSEQSSPPPSISEAGSSLQLTVLGHDAARYPAFGHRKLVNQGCHTLSTRGSFDSYLAVPLVQCATEEIRPAGKEF